MNVIDIHGIRFAGSRGYSVLHTEHTTGVYRSGYIHVYKLVQHADHTGILDSYYDINWKNFIYWIKKPSTIYNRTAVFGNEGEGKRIDVAPVWVMILSIVIVVVIMTLIHFIYAVTTDKIKSLWDLYSTFIAGTVMYGMTFVCLMLFTEIPIMLILMNIYKKTV